MPTTCLPPPANRQAPRFNFVSQSLNNAKIRFCEASARRTGEDPHGAVGLAAFNTDGFDVSGQNIHIHDCAVRNQDDTFCIQAEGGPRPRKTFGSRTPRPAAGPPTPALSRAAAAGPASRALRARPQPPRDPLPAHPPTAALPCAARGRRAEGATTTRPGHAHAHAHATLTPRPSRCARFRVGQVGFERSGSVGLSGSLGSVGSVGWVGLVGSRG